MNFIVTYYRDETPLCIQQTNSLRRAQEIAKDFRSNEATHAVISELGRRLDVYPSSRYTGATQRL